MKNERLNIILTCPGRNVVPVKIVTDEGGHGLGDATLNGRERAVRAYLEDHVFPGRLGRDPRDIEVIWPSVSRGAGGR
ncbi:bifunctional D-altronate/D-mannonate dehydratase, partial [Burkholderia pseudomallei]